MAPWQDICNRQTLARLALDPQCLRALDLPSAQHIEPNDAEQKRAPDEIDEASSCTLRPSGNNAVNARVYKLARTFAPVTIRNGKRLI